MTPDYAEDESGAAISKADMIAHVTGTKNPIILDDPESVLRLGPSQMTDADAWTVDAANLRTFSRLPRTFLRVAGINLQHHLRTSYLRARKPNFSDSSRRPANRRWKFLRWFDRFLPRLAQGQPANLLKPAKISDPTDPTIAHLIGLNLNKGWVWRRLAGLLDAEDPRRALAIEAGAAHYAAALPLLDAQDFNRSHWLPSFAVYTMTE